jgi:hypothetical protein
MAKNEGPGKIPGDLPVVLRFKPVAISWPVINTSPIFLDPKADWETTLKIQIEKDIPNKYTL